MADKKYIICDKAETAALLDFAQLTDAIEQASQEYTQGQITSPERMVVPMALGGVMLSMPAVSEDLAIHKLVNVQPKNRDLNIPTIHGHVSVYDAETGSPLFILDGPEVTGRRTAAVTMLVIRTFKEALPKEILIIGTGTQATYHLQAIQALYPESKVWMRGINAADAQQFCTTNRRVHPNLHPCVDDEVPETVDVIITLTTSTVPVYNQSGQVGRLVVGVGAFKPEMAEIGKNTLFSSDIYIDDPAGAKHEAGDLIQAGIDWTQTRSLASAFTDTPDLTRPIVFKSVGTGAWDLAACRVARAKLGV
ncbi:MULTISPECIES: bifunctional Delta(1)-pyrroline-2-carboxylate/Delta(1)-piperideine-2-carboxylate reductase [Pseudomonas]|jgi:1-piperideine-2-carboxylate/1-pyrroline-2-carboxylate reductase [NAD(P)H]|uniref:bifunctional Delta(1)-pyrroline-2-carboxylate/Delta(1)-piperideine-2- carboxylate reductase n=1 Tax=Pseudomonas TaxID=286 RepID=UPI000CFF041D|nr:MULTISPECIES: bifunctional Delta(1)-pyrroline-2-carboxylate/Delta(1)-piperideine-2-carboxylate reductase [Pseudomonas]PRA51969.1 ornithine cyclodeaminase [Pseudomonas sp. MYb115]QXN51374.1 delta(1)-pyrroline-2-carboxylate reductase family protein [Pseudomonas fluorescens]WSO25691.1 bifunctional Delta(1)-pyrroline-2-carboxylate/Delta(1)-piperideine-2-carboxylate reductase [Pseudomonas fluorescens]